MLSIQQAKHYLHDADDKVELGRVLSFVTSKHFQRVLKLHNKLVDVSVQMPARPEDPPTATSLCNGVLCSVTSARSNNKYASELVKILGETHFEVSRMSVHYVDVSVDVLSYYEVAMKHKVLCQLRIGVEGLRLK